VREICVFAKHDVTRDPPFSAMDLVSCRNVMIYLGPDLQDRLVALLHYALREKGFLLLGRSEALRAFSGFAQLDGKNKIYARASAAPRLASEFATPMLWRGATPAGLSAAGLVDRSAAMRASSQTDVHREADRLVLAEFAPPGIVVASDLAIVQFRGHTAPFLEPVAGAASLDVMRMVREEMRLPLRRAIDRASSTQSPAREAGLRLVVGDQILVVTLEVTPFAVNAPQQRFFLVLFKDVATKTPATDGPPSSSPSDGEEATGRDLQRELASTRQYLESVIEQLEATNEELQSASEETVSSNEELRSTNEELQSAKEELQASNEELRTINDEMSERNVEGTRLNDDLTNVLNSVETPMLIVGRDLRLRRFTPAAAKAFGLAAADLRRPLTDARPLMAIAPTLVALISEVVDGLRPAESTIRDGAGRWRHLSVRPYVTLDDRIEGTVITARDVDAVTRASERMEAARKYAQDIVDALRSGVLVLDRDLRVRSANAAFVRMFGATQQNLEGMRVGELAIPALATPLLLRFLEEFRQGGGAGALRLECADGAGHPRVLEVNLRDIGGLDLLVVTLEDVTEAERARTLAVEVGFHEALTGATEGILMVDAAGRIAFANHAITALFGYGIEELAGQPANALLPGGLREVRIPLVDGSQASVQTKMPWHPDLVGRRKDGTEFPVEISTSTMTREGGPMVLAFITDVTERRTADRELRDYQHRLQEMAFDAAVTEEQERRRIAIDLHDSVGQDLALAQIKLGPIRTALAGESRVAFDEAMTLVGKAIGDTRTLVFDLSPPLLYDLGLKEVLAWLAEDLENRHGVTIEVTDDGNDKPLDDMPKSIVFRAIREVVMNVIKHAKVTAASVSLRRDDGHLRVDVEDHGVGFDSDASARGPTTGTFGLLSVREQLRRLGGSLSIRSAPQQGTTVTLLVPMGAANESRRADTDPPPAGNGAP
jgi:PAS domain S-box-containing protein